MALERLLPDPGPTSIAEQLATFRPRELAEPLRPYVFTNFAETLDGHATLDGKSGKIAGDTDTQMLLGLRELPDAVMVGAGTLRAERYGRIIAKPERRERREAAGLAPDPLAVVISERLELPWDIPLFTDGGGEVVIFTASDQEPAETVTPHTIVRHPGGVDLSRAMEELRTEYGVASHALRGRPPPTCLAAAEPGSSTSSSSRSAPRSPAAPAPGSPRAWPASRSTSSCVAAARRQRALRPLGRQAVGRRPAWKSYDRDWPRNRGCLLCGAMP